MEAVKDLYKIIPIHQRLQVFVEHVKIADSNDVWLLLDITLSKPNMQYLIPMKNVEQHFIRNHDHAMQKEVTRPVKLIIHNPYRIEIDKIGWVHDKLEYDGKTMDKMMVFDYRKVSYQLDPI